MSNFRNNKITTFKRICKFKVEEKCPHGRRCRFRHLKNYKTELCRHKTLENCPFDRNCNFLHIDDPKDNIIEIPKKKNKPNYNNAKDFSYEDIVPLKREEKKPLKQLYHKDGKLRSQAIKRDEQCKYGNNGDIKSVDNRNMKGGLHITCNVS